MLKRREERDTEKTSEKGSMVSRKKKNYTKFFSYVWHNSIVFQNVLFKVKLGMRQSNEYWKYVSGLHSARILNWFSWMNFQSQ